MKWFETFLAYLFPSILIDNPSWSEKWRRQQKEQFLRYATYFFGIVGVGYIANYFFFDLPMGLQPSEFWLQFRLSISTLAFLCLVFYLSPLAKWKGYKLPAIVTCFVITYTQAKVAVWFHQDAWIFFYVFIITSVLFLGLNILASTIFASCISLAGAPVLIEAGLSNEYIASSTLVTIVVTVILRRSTVTEVRNFLLNEENIENQTKIAGISNEYAERIRSFIPKVIADRMSYLIDTKKYSVVEASLEALKARKKNVACLFTDIRGFTQGSKSLEKFITESVLPEVTACSNAIEDFDGIPRKIGDLIFAYFDDESIHLNVIKALAAGIEVARLNETMNISSTHMQINRYILISSGEAIVGNFGGLDTSVEITALGTPVNFLSRVDDLTKAPAIAEQLSSGDLIVSAAVVEKVSELGVSLPFDLIDLKLLGLEIRDFPETKNLYRLSPTAEVRDLVDAVVEAIPNPS